MSESSSNSVIEKVRRALGRTGTLTVPPVPPKINEPVARLVHSEIGLPELFTTRAQANKMHVTAVYPEEAAGKIVAFLQSQNLSKIALPQSKLLDQLNIPAALLQAGLDARTWDQLTLDQLYDLQASVTDVTYAIAETGSLVIQSSAVHGRSISLVPEVHIAVVEPRNCVADLLDLMEKLKETGPGNNTTIITGPSKTADIEGALVTGVHGPARVEVFLLK